VLIQKEETSSKKKNRHQKRRIDIKRDEGKRDPWKSKETYKRLKHDDLRA